MQSPPEWSPVTGKPGEPPLDPWSIVHFASGLALGTVLHHPTLVLALLAAYEAFEGALRRVKGRRTGKGVFEHESWTNIVHDVLFGMLGWVFAQGLPRLDLWPWPW
jgi:hypothetical protein